ncbi:piggyBac transposable element-derived protein 3-like [Phymastichus coffea]|uniref:piggyBac transposable element-derived protein 3-like n=1 Tax=Phymastichus coffea TaxID=108790 RepID=UPI00273CADFB|nr:piggyBac transposable element-derived protein 3-like [Phymastichus coffea]
MSDSEEVYEGDQIPSDDESVDGNGISDEEGYDLNVDSGKHYENDSRRFKKSKISSDETWSNQSLPFDNLPFTKNVGPKNIPDTNKIKNDVPVTADEIKKFIGVNIMIGVKHLLSYRDSWPSNPQLNDAYISSSMPVKRFSFLLSNLHLNDQTKEPKKGEVNFDKLYKIRPFIDRISETYMQYYDPTREQSIDESMVKFKSRNTMKQYMPQKPIKQGYKIWVRSDMNGYVCEFQIYTGKINNVTKKNLGERVIMSLSQTLKNKNYHIYFDNYFTSTNLMITLLKDGISACGTIRKDDLPKNQGKDKDMKMGDNQYRPSNEGIRYLKWLDKKPVHFLSNFHDPSDLSEVERRQKDGSLKTIACPQIAKDYNAHMGFVDKSDQMKSFYEITRKSRK